jgi:PAS domain S-box-containing protein
MHFQATMSVFPLLLAAALSSVLSLYALRHRTVAGALGFAALTLAVTVWVVGYALEIAGADLATKILFAKIQYLGIVTVPVAWLVFALQFSQHQYWLTRRTIALLIVIPAATVLLVFSNELHSLIWRATSLDRSGPFLALQVGHGGWFWVHFGYSYLLILLGTILLGIAVVRMPQIYRQQALAVLLAALFPSVGNLLYLVGLNPIPQLDLTPFAFTLTSIIWAWSIFGFRLLDLAPIAREAVLEAMRQGVLTLDMQDRIVDMNPAAARMLDMTTHQAVGRLAADVLGAQFGLFQQHYNGTEAQTELTIGVGATRRAIELRMSPIADRQARPLGRLIMLRDITETKRADEERQKLLALIEYSSDFIGMATLDGKLMFLNAAGQKLVGLRNMDDVRSKMMFDFIAATSLPLFQTEILPITLRDGAWNGEIWFQHFGGAKPVPVQMSVFLIKHQHTGEPLAFASVSRDITKLRQQTEQIALLNQITRAAIETRDLRHMLQTQAEHLGKLIGADACYIDLWDQARQKMIPAAAAGPLQASYPGLKMTSSQPAWSSAVREAGHTLVAEDVLNTLQIDPGLAKQLALASALGLPLISDGNMFGAALIACNQPHHFSAEEIALGEQAARQIALAVANARLYQAVADERSRLQAMIRSNRDGVVLIGTDLRILVINESALRLMQVPGQPEEWTNQPLNAALDVLHQYAPDVVGVTQDEMRRVIAGDQAPGEGEYQVQSRFIRWLNLPVRTGVTALGRLLVLHDVTEERLLDQLRDDLTRTMVHDLRNPLSGIWGALDILRLIHPTDGETHDLIEIARHSTKNMLGLVNAILDVSRLESGQMPLNRDALALDRLVSEIIQLQIPLTSTKQLHVINDVPQFLPPVWADDDLMRRVFQNLIGNAIKFTPEDGNITISACLQNDNPAQMLVAIGDTGPGIPEALRSRLFEKFVTGATAGVGSGLGLAFCRLAIEAHGGKIWIDSNVTQGTTFKFTMPMVQELDSMQSALLSAENG